jgi:hypothetical protein
MSVVVFISDAKNEVEEKFSIPVASEQFFKKYWVHAIEELNLELLSQIEYGLELEYSELSIIIYELNRMLKWVENNLSGSDKSLMEERIKLLIEKLPEAFIDVSNKVYIG